MALRCVAKTLEPLTYRLQRREHSLTPGVIVFIPWRQPFFGGGADGAGRGAGAGAGLGAGADGLVAGAGELGRCCCQVLNFCSCCRSCCSFRSCTGGAGRTSGCVGCDVERRLPLAPCWRNSALSAHLCGFVFPHSCAFVMVVFDARSSLLLVDAWLRPRHLLHLRSISVRNGANERKLIPYSAPPAGPDRAWLIHRLLIQMAAGNRLPLVHRTRRSRRSSYRNHRAAHHRSRRPRIRRHGMSRAHHAVANRLGGNHMAHRSRGNLMRVDLHNVLRHRPRVHERIARDHRHVPFVCALTLRKKS